MRRKRLFLSAMMAAAALHAGAQISMTVDATQRGPLVSPYQYGLFFEEINHAGDGGLYAELVKNRSFEEGLDGWSAVGGAALSLTTSALMNTAQGQALSVNVTSASATNRKGVANSGFWGMNVQRDSTYTLSLWVKGAASFTGNLTAQLRAADGQVIGESEIEGSVSATEWNKLTATIKATGTDNAGQLVLLTGNNGRLYIDMVSLFPYTWRNRPNGLRPDLAQLLADTRPTFLRFPGGCYVEGEGSYDNAFQWKKTIGPVEQRPGHMNQNWHYRSSDGLGYDEYLQLAEDLGAAPMFVVNIGLGHGFTLSLEETETLVQDCLDAIEYANGDATTEWGARRIANGHAEPYNLKFIEVGNENYQAGDVGYVERYYMFYKAIKEKYPEIVVIGNVEAWGTDTPSWRNKYPVDLVDEHYYRSHSWMTENYNKYDNTPRTIGIYNGEYAANAAGTYGTYGNMNSALGEAVYMLGMERNSDVCRMASFAPIFMHEQDPCWPYDMIHFKQGANFVTPSYHVQKILGNSLGHRNMTWTETGNTLAADPAAPVSVGVGSWSTQVVYDDVTVTLADGTVVAQDDFAAGMGNWKPGLGSWSASGGELTQTQEIENCTAVLNVPVTGGDYTYKLRAKKTSGWEGFLVMFDYQDSNNYTWWNIGGWTNTQHGVEKCVNGSKTTVATAGGSVETGRWYDIEIRKEGNTVTCLLDGKEIHKFTTEAQRAIYQSLQMTEDGSAMLLKVVNPYSQAQQLTLNAANMTLVSARTEYSLKAESGLAENTMDSPSNVAPDVTPDAPSAETAAAEGKIVLDVPAYSLTVYRIAIADVAPEVVEDNAYTREDAGKYGYLYAHMHTTQEITCYALSDNGTYWRDLFGSKEAFPAKNYTETGGMRDAYICRTETGNFLLAGTDMTSALGWTSNHRMTFMHSNDLVHWDKHISIDLESPENMKALGLTDVNDMTAAWAPQIIYDPVTKKYMAYYSVGFPDRHRIYYSLLSEDLTEVSKPMVLFDPGYDVIDADIVWNEAEGQYVMVFKREGDRALSRAMAPYLVPTGDKTTGACQWVRDPDFGIDESGQSIEAPSQFRYIGSKRWQLGYQKYSNGYNYRIMDLDEHGANPVNRRDMSGDVAPQHGSFVKLTETEYRYLETWEKVVEMLAEVKPIHEVLPTDEAREAIEKAESALADDRGSLEANAAAMQAAMEALEKALEKTPNVNEYLLEQARQGKETDLTPLVVNADFSAGSTGWTTSPAFTAANGYVAEYWNTNFDFSQTIEGLPEGEYEVGVQGFYRMGGISEATAAHNNGTEVLNSIFYANSTTTPVMSLYDGSASGTYSMSPYNYPDNVTTANEAFNKNSLYGNKMKVEVRDGRLTIGIRKTDYVNADWCCFDNFTLRYLGKISSVEGVKADAGKDTARCHNLQGMPIDGMDGYHGIYISNGQKKIKKLN